MHTFLSFQALLNKIDPKNINEFPQTLNYYTTILIIPGLMTSIVLLMYYFRNQQMRRFLALEISEWLGKIAEDFQLLRYP